MNIVNELRELVLNTNRVAMASDTTAIDSILKDARTLAEKLPVTALDNLLKSFNNNFLIDEYDAAWPLLLASLAFEHLCENKKADALRKVIDDNVTKCEVVEDYDWGYFTDDLNQYLVKDCESLVNFFVITSVVIISNREMEVNTAVSAPQQLNINLIAAKIAQEINGGEFSINDEFGYCFDNGSFLTLSESVIEVPEAEIQVLKNHLPYLEFTDLGLSNEAAYQYACAKDESLDVPYTAIFTGAANTNKEAFTLFARDKSQAESIFTSTYPESTLIDMMCIDNAKTALILNQEY
ncbi:hypothetical protein OCF84_21720 (plasmid) [Shewanella xiamenensis]|uniref:Uncharacterized protein n=1 Tax=Shewanella xiamenensis TaxID=332186 RepID=A0ABT6UDF6_9GAMM|nr:hypothetical protein [Shewanella xiamenensis]MDI5832502.1 hypothetical protein [Shewanella xiamenensis]WHF57879.1 hypothetical protein OCF84_21720 [Shewanella xiamenensis]